MSYSPSLRLFVPDDLAPDSAFALTADQARYLGQVMRRSAGERVDLFNGRDGEWQAEITELGKKNAVVTPVSQLRSQASLKPLTLLFAPVKRGAIDLIAQKATELGVTGLRPVITGRTNVDRVNTERLTSIAIEAAEQSRRMCVPVVWAPASLSDVVADWSPETPLYLMDETGEGAPVGEVLASGEARNADSAAFLIGPEGGFTDTELDLLRALPFSKSISLGTRILRADTAALAALTCWQALCGDWRRPA